MDAIMLAKEITPYYIHWLKSTYKSLFPFVCMYASEIFASYTQTHFGTGDLVQGICFGRPHWWIDVNGTIIDFTYFQFQNKSRKYDADTLMQLFFANHEHIKTCTKNYFAFTIHQPRWLTQAAEGTFDKFLNRVSKPTILQTMAMHPPKTLKKYKKQM